MLKISRGDDGVVSGTASGVPVTDADKVMIANYDGDGRADLLRPEGNNWRNHRSSGTTLPGSSPAYLPSPSAASATTFVADIAGSG